MNLIEHPIVKAFAPLAMFLALAGWLNRPAVENERLERGAMWELRVLGSAELAYQDANNNKDYGTWSRLRRESPEFAGRSRSDLIQGYSLAVFEVRMLPEWGCGMDSGFAVVALPRQHGLRTYALCDDQSLREASSDHAYLGPWQCPVHLRLPATGHC